VSLLVTPPGKTEAGEARDWTEVQGRQIAGKKNPKQLMEAWDLKMHKPWW